MRMSAQDVGIQLGIEVVLDFASMRFALMLRVVEQVAVVRVEVGVAGCASLEELELGVLARQDPLFVLVFHWGPGVAKLLSCGFLVGSGVEHVAVGSEVRHGIVDRVLNLLMISTRVHFRAVRTGADGIARELNSLVLRRQSPSAELLLAVVHVLDRVLHVMVHAKIGHLVVDGIAIDL